MVARSGAGRRIDHLGSVVRFVGDRGGGWHVRSKSGGAVRLRGSCGRRCRFFISWLGAGSSLRGGICKGRGLPSLFVATRTAVGRWRWSVGWL